MLECMGGICKGVQCVSYLNVEDDNATFIVAHIKCKMITNDNKMNSPYY